MQWFARFFISSSIFVIKNTGILSNHVNAFLLTVNTKPPTYELEKKKPLLNNKGKGRLCHSR